MQNILKNKSFEFALSNIRLYKILTEVKKEYVMSKQLLRSGTSVGAMIREAQNAESKMDFVHKLGIAQKECDESLYWLELLEASNYLTSEERKVVHDQGVEILKIIKSAILTTKSKLTSKR